MQAMPVLEAILNGTEVLPVPFAADPYNPEQTVVIVPREDDLGNTFHVRCDEAAELYWNDTDNRLNPFEDFGPLRLPGGAVWIEYKWPKRGYVPGDGWIDFPPNMWGAVGITETPDDEGLFTIECTQYRLSDKLYHVNVGEKFTVDKDGRAVGEDMWWTSPNTVPDDYAREVQSQLGDAKLKALAHPCRIGLIAVGLMNCKNVTTTETDKGGPRRRKSRGKKNPRMTYRTINIPGRNTQTEANGTPAEKAEYALHRVRGHFKTYTAERPLMGQHVGTYWWGWQARGKAKNGVSVTDYKVGTGV